MIFCLWFLLHVCVCTVDIRACVADQGWDIGDVGPLLHVSTTWLSLPFLVNEDSEHTLWGSEVAPHFFDSKVCRQATVCFQCEIKLGKVLPWYKCRVKLDREHAEITFQRILKDVALAHSREERDDFRILELVNINCLINLCQSYRNILLRA